MNRLVLSSEFRDAIVAHELAHYVLGHDAPLVGATPDARRREVEQRELDANAKAVEILTWVRGVPEDQALRMAYSYLLNVHRRLLALPRRGPAGPPPPLRRDRRPAGRYPGAAHLDRGPRVAPRRPPVGG